jgi:sterol desaturase/sphingolipid hydroxylase (fatty acid hydroxylase superfamily)
VHRDLHVRAPLTAFGRFLRFHHMHHHHTDARTNHGVTSAVWDLVWRTHRTADRIRVPAKKAPLWMLDPPPGASWAEDYEIIGKDHAR